MKAWLYRYIASKFDDQLIYSYLEWTITCSELKFCVLSIGLYHAQWNEIMIITQIHSDAWCYRDKAFL